MHRRLAVAGVLTVLMAQPPASAQAADPNVNVDPRSPAGTEYAIPLAQARRDASGGATVRGRGGDTRFGIGITPATGAQRSAGPRSPNNPRRQSARAASGGAFGGPPATSQPLSTRALASSTGTGWQIPVLAAAVLGLGTGAGLLARRSSRADGRR